MESGVAVTITERRDPDLVAEVLRSLPNWFGIDDAIQRYVRDATDPDFTSLVASRGGHGVGVALLRHHYPESTELHLIAVHASQRRAGVGRILVSAAADLVRSGGGKLLSVHTVGPSFSDPGYAETRKFYRAMGFIPVEEHDDLDWPGPTLILVRPLLPEP